MVKLPGKKFGIVINPDTPFSKIEQYLDGAHIVLVMSVLGSGTQFCVRMHI